tara:strand:+ start:588 stop:707 length:120 start_codon:yes stop_codon:yes gene_type:complete
LVLVEMNPQQQEMEVVDLDGRIISQYHQVNNILLKLVVV